MQDSLLDDYVTALETALVEYIVKYGFTDQARAILAARGRHFPRDRSDRGATPSEETSS